MDYQQIEQELAMMSKRSKLYILVKNELEKRGNWKAAPRGKAFNRGEDIRRKSLQRITAPADIHLEQTDWGA